MFEHYFLLLSVTLNFCYMFLIVPDKNDRVKKMSDWLREIKGRLDIKHRENLELYDQLDTWKFLAKKLQDELDQK